MSCEKCRFRASYDKKPDALLGKLWRWHINFCPGWKRYYKKLPPEQRGIIAERYKLK